MPALLRSRKFWTLIVDVLTSVILYFGAKYAGASFYEDIKFLITILQPVFAILIGAIAYEDGAKSKAQRYVGAPTA